MLKLERAEVRAAATAQPAGPYADKRRAAQIAARHALQRVAFGLKARGLASSERTVRERALFAAVHAAELQLPDSWLPFVVSR